MRACALKRARPLALVVLACLSPSEALAAESLSTLRALAAIRSLPLHPTTRVSAVRMAMVSAAARVGRLKASAAIDFDGDDTAVAALAAPPAAAAFLCGRRRRGR